MISVTGKKVLILGAGRSGTSAARLCSRWGGLPVIYDDKEVQLPNDLKNPELHFRGQQTSILDNCSLVVVSPGFSLSHSLIREAVKKKIRVMSELAFGCSGIDTPIIAVTGTNGKTTTVSLIGHLLTWANKKVCVAGNNGIPISSVYDEAKRSDWLVLEVSSFQLELPDGFNPDIAVWLNLTPDHLSRHGSIEEYAALKGRLFENLKEDGVGIINASDPVVAKSVEKLGLKRALKFSSHEDKGVDGWVDKNGRLSIIGNFVGTDPRVCPFTFPTEQLQLIGRHNHENVLASLLAVSASGIDLKDVRDGLGRFQAPEHRLQLVRELGGVKYYNDSKSTNVDSAMRALESFDSRIVWIAGGRDKGSSYMPLAKLAKKRVRELILLGEAAPKIKGELGNFVEDTIVVSDLSNAVRLSCERAKKGDVVLFSPACSSYDMFSDFEERGRAFVGEVRKL